jgi:hypothetical protein
MKLPPEGGIYVVGCWPRRDEIPEIDAQAHVDVIEKQRTIACSIREIYHAPVLFSCSQRALGYADSSGRVTALSRPFS